jgi:hypothetical protein
MDSVFVWQECSAYIELHKQRPDNLGAIRQWVEAQGRRYGFIDSASKGENTIAPPVWRWASSPKAELVISADLEPLLSQRSTWLSEGYTKIVIGRWRTGLHFCLVLTDGEYSRFTEGLIDERSHKQLMRWSNGLKLSNPKFSFDEFVSLTLKLKGDMATIRKENMDDMKAGSTK